MRSAIVVGWMFALVGCADQTASPLTNTESDGPSVISHMSVTEVASLLKSDPEVRVLDVRTGFEFGFGNIAGAEQINYFSFSFRERVAQLDRNATWVVHCKSGHRSGPSVRIMEELGFTSIIHMDGGFDAWKRAGLPINQ